MSKLIDKLNQASQSAPQPIGFRAVQPASSKPKMLLIAKPTKSDADNLAEYISGADGVLLHIPQNPTAKTLQKVSRTIPEIPWGWWLEGNGQRKIERIAKAGYDFIAFPATSTSLAIPKGDKVGRILQVEASISEGLLRTVGDLPVDAVLVTSEREGEYPLTWHHLMLFQRFANLLTKPLLVSIPSNITTGELQALWDAGVSGVIVEAETGQPAGKLNGLRQAIDKLTVPSSHKERKGKALIPHITAETALSEEEGEE